MAIPLIAIIGVLVLLVLVLLVWLIITISAGRRETAGQAANIGLLQQQLEALRAAQETTRDALQKSLQSGQNSLNENLQSSQKILSQLNTQIGELQGTNKRMLQVGTEVRRLQDILSSPKLRGQMGEWSLENLLATILPTDSFELQHTFRDGKTVDALIKLADFSVPVDESYIRPAEGTLDFALMYIPAENIYYETIVKYESDTKDILNYSLDRKVIPVSPNLLYAYLMTVVMGLHGLQIEKQAAEIRQNLKKLNASFASFAGTWDILGKHLRNANAQYEEGNQKLNRFGLELTQIQTEENNET